MQSEHEVIQLWAHVVLLALSLLLSAWREWRHEQLESRLRKKLGACRSALDAAEILRDRYRRERDGLSIEVGKYRKSLPLSDRLTQVLTTDPDKQE